MNRISRFSISGMLVTFIPPGPIGPPGLPRGGWPAPPGRGPDGPLGLLKLPAPYRSLAPVSLAPLGLYRPDPRLPELLSRSYRSEAVSGGRFASISLSIVVLISSILTGGYAASSGT